MARPKSLILPPDLTRTKASDRILQASLTSQPRERPLSNLRLEKFVQLFSAGVSAEKAYISAGFSTTNPGAAVSRFTKDAKVLGRIAHIRGVSMATEVVSSLFDHARVLNRLDLLSRGAERDGNYSAAVTAEMAIGKHLGMFLDRAGDANKWDGDLRKLSRAQLANLRESLAARREELESTAGILTVESLEDPAPGTKTPGASPGAILVEVSKDGDDGAEADGGATGDHAEAGSAGD